MVFDFPTREVVDLILHPAKKPCIGGKRALHPVEGFSRGQFLTILPGGTVDLLLHKAKGKGFEGDFGWVFGLFPHVVLMALNWFGVEQRTPLILASKAPCCVQISETFHAGGVVPAVPGRLHLGIPFES